MIIGATNQEIEESKKQNLNSRDKRHIRRESDKTVYYYLTDEKTPDPRIYPEEIYVPIENYAAELIRQLDFYLKRIDLDLDVDKVAVLVTLRKTIFPNDKEFQFVHENQSICVWEMVQRYTKCIMQMVGNLAECVIVDSCANNPVINLICMNIALFKSEILESYDIPYDDYVAYSTSFSYMLFIDPKDGKPKTRSNKYYNPHHTSMDIGWCKKENIWDQLRTEMSEIRYVDNAKLQVKATLDCRNLYLDDYLLTPVIVFDFDHGYIKLKERYPHHLIYSAYDLFPEVALQMEKYFKIIAAYVSGITKKLNITETDIKNDKRLQTLFDTSVHEITERKREIDRTELIKIARDAGKPVIINY